MYPNDKINPKLSIFDSIELVNEAHWNSIVGNSNIYLSIPYLSALEKALQNIIDFRYTLFYNDELQPIAVSYLQIIDIEEYDASKYTKTFCHVGDKVKNKLIGIGEARVLTCGNVFACGENGFAYLPHLDSMVAFDMLAQSMRRISLEKDKNGRISIGLLKEFWPESIPNSDRLLDSKFKGFFIDVNMVLDVQPDWQKIDDYLNVMTTKFRTKAKSVYNKSADLIVKELNLEQIVAYQSRIEELYKAVLAKAEFKFGELNGQAFTNFKKHLNDSFVLKAYFIDDNMVGFSTLFVHNEKGDANYVGFDYEHNKTHSIYQRMLYDLVDEAIRKQLKSLNLGRTAETLKSSIGAKPVNMKLYARHRNGFTNKLIGPLISSISPSEFELRPPFKKDQN